jgi:signal transduction histidine kinase
VSAPVRRLTSLTIVLMVVVAVVIGYIMMHAAERYVDELTQRLNANIAMYVDRAAPLVKEGRVDEARLAELSRQAMIINPLARVYLLDTQGSVHGQSGPRMDLRPLQEVLSGRARWPVYGDDPSRPGVRRIFSVAPVHDKGRPFGYVYVLLGGDQSESLAAAVASSHILSVAFAALALVLLCGAISAWLLTRAVSRPVAILHRRVLELAASLDPDGSVSQVRRHDDLAAVEAAVEMLATRSRSLVEDLRKIDTERRVLFEGIGHDLRTPLTAANGYVETLMEDEFIRSHTPLHSRLEVVHRHLHRLTRLVNQIFRLARLESPTLYIQPETVLLQELIGDIGAKFAGHAAGEHPRLRVTVDREAPPVYSNYELIETVVENLVDNALRHTPSDSLVVLAVQTRGGDVEVSVRDNGSGIAPEHVPELSRPLRSGIQDRKGLGLAIVTRALVRLGSRLCVRSQPGAGTVMFFYLPGLREDSVINCSPT